jgi:hypothetical protein
MISNPIHTQFSVKRLTPLLPSHRSYVINTFVGYSEGARGSVVGSGTNATSRKVAGSSPDDDSFQLN